MACQTAPLRLEGAYGQAPEKLLESGAFMTAEDFTDPHLRALLDTQM